MGIGNAVWASVSALGAAAVGVSMMTGACSSSSSGGATGGGDSGAGCSVSAGQFPPPACDDTSDVACSPKNLCQIDENHCGSKSTCLPMATNTPTVQNFRIRRLSIAAPYALSEANSPIVQETVVDKGIDLNAPTCGENGDGSFTWLLSIDRNSNVLTSGGSPPSADPFGAGYCLVNYTTSGGIVLKPVTLPAHFTGATFSTDPVPKLNIPIFVQNDVNNLVILPISNAQFQNVTISPDGNCIGTLNYPPLDSTCSVNRSDCQKWKTAGSLGGFITLEEADKVPISLLGNKSLCVFLTGAAGSQLSSDGLHCARGADGKIALQGDYCSSPAAPGGCQDSYWLAATFAAAAVKINDGAGVPQCQPVAVDGGADSGGGNDAAAD